MLAVCGAQTRGAGSSGGGLSDGKRAKEGRRLEGNDSVSGFFLINLHAVLESCHRRSEDLVEGRDTTAAPLYGSPAVYSLGDTNPAVLPH